ncbi:MAG: 23S rRNA (pseudouridine(1915)-N(3))-methyltransferase RlmH [Gammaproteobacteria bacterium]|jgi:23S rRNA (pseudouridine1915-N3)-methyltransferase|nr:23S rRNA (pseudouridine(1915)-N(3))-methyltransferase RlmH [Gammaproteobacteria bacterium]
MKIRLLAIGSRPDDWVRSGVDTYLERLPAHLKPELVEIPLSLRSSGGDPAVARAKEGQRILERLKPDEFVITLDERGKPWSSVELSRQLARWQAEENAVALVIGGPEGLADGVRKRANQSWSLSALTFPHGMVRVIVIEQLYRAWTILQGHPYHKV